MKIAELFATRVEEKIEPVIKVAETADEGKLAREIGGYVVTPLIEGYIDDFLEHYTDTFQVQTGEIGTWISGYFGSGKSHLAKMLGLLVENRKLQGIPAAERFKARVPPDSPQRSSIERSLARLSQVQTKVMGFNLQSIADAKTSPLAKLLLSQFYISKGYGGNLIYAKVIEAELDRLGKLAALHSAVEKRAGRKWSEVQGNLAFFRKALYAAAVEVAPEHFGSEAEVDRSLLETQGGELFNVEFLVSTMLRHLDELESSKKVPQRLLLVLDETGQWVDKDAGRLAQIQALIEEAAIRGQGKLWVAVTTHGDMGSIYKEAKAVEGDMKKNEGRFRFKFPLTTENIEKVLEDRLLKKTIPATQELDDIYAKKGGMIRGLGQLTNCDQALPECTAEKFPAYYPYFPYQVHLVPEIVKSLRSKGGRGEQLGGSTRTLLAITQDILRAGRRKYLGAAVGEVVSFDEVYANLAAEGEISPDVRTELSRLASVVPGATALTSRVAEVLYLVRELPYVPRTKENIARLLMEHLDEDLASVLARVEPELERLIKARLVARIGDAYEFLTGERRTFEEAIASVEGQLNWPDAEKGFAENFVARDNQSQCGEWLDFTTVSWLGNEFGFQLSVDDTNVPGRRADVKLKVLSPLAAMVGGGAISEVESRSLRKDEDASVFVVCPHIPGFEGDVKRYLAMREVIDNWKRDPHKSDDARKLAHDREEQDLPKLKGSVVRSLKEALRRAFVVFRSASHSLVCKEGQKPSEALRADIVAYWPAIYPKFDKVPVRIGNDQRAITDVMAGKTELPTDVAALKLFDAGGRIDQNSPLVDEIRVYLSQKKAAGQRAVGGDLLSHLGSPPFGWDHNAVRVATAALIRHGAIKAFVQKKPLTNPADPQLVEAVKSIRVFEKAELELEIANLDQEVLTETRSFLMRLSKKRKLDETPAALSEEAGALACSVLAQYKTLSVWADAVGLPLPAELADGVEAWRKVESLTNPLHRVLEVNASRAVLEKGLDLVTTYSDFQTKHGAAFKQYSEFVHSLVHIERWFDAGTGVKQLLAANDAVVSAASFGDPESWKQLLSLRDQAILERRELLETFRKEARELLERAIARLPADLTARGLPPELESRLSGAARALLDKSAGELPVPELTALPDRAAKVVRELGAAIVAAEAKRRAKEAGEGAGAGAGSSADGAGPKPRRLRVADVTTVTTISNEAEWRSVRDALDTEVRALLQKGFTVELD
jgi:hypothetical protein